MVQITKTEKEKIKAMYPWARIMRPMKNRSKRKHYYLEENPILKRYLAEIRKENIVSENGQEVQYPKARKPKPYKKYEKTGQRRYKSFDSIKKQDFKNNYRKRTDFKPKGGWKTDNNRNNNYDNRHSNWNDRQDKKHSKSYKKDMWS